MRALIKLFSDFALAPKLLKHVRNWPVFVLDHFKLQKQPYQLRLRNGLQFNIRPGTTDKGVLVEVFMLEDYKDALDYIKGAEVIIDIGAQIGSFSLFAHHANPKAKILAFEPCVSNFASLESNLKLNQADNVQPQHRAVVSETREVKLFISDNNTGAHSIYHTTSKAEIVKGLGINELFDSFGVTRCDLIKMDCEGAEWEIIQSISAKNLAAVRAIIMEYHDPDRIDIIEAKLKEHGFHVRRPHYPLLFAYRE